MISQYFSLAEMTRSEWAVRNNADNSPPAEMLGNLRKLCLLLDLIRMGLGVPIIVQSGYRSWAVNAAVSGSSISAHMAGRAADINALGMSAAALARFIRRSHFVADVDKCILEYPDSPNGGWVHVQIPVGTNKPRMQFLVARKVDGVTVYEPMP
jgi:hypothetical protein